MSESDFARGWLLAELASREGVMLKQIDVELNEGNFYDAVLFAQIRYWHSPAKNGASRLRVQRDGHLWLAKKYDEWGEECFINEHTAKKAIKRIKDRGLIITNLWHFAGVPTVHIRLNWPEFERQLLAIRPVGSSLLELSGLMDQSYQVYCSTETTTETTGNNDSHALCLADGCTARVNADGEQCLYCQMRGAWAEYFPDKPQPRVYNKSLRAKVKTRAKSQHFVDHWREAMARASRANFCLSGGWFDFEWFVKNDEHYERCLNGRYDDQPGNGSGNGSEIDKHATLEELGKLISTYGRVNFKTAQTAASFDLLKLVRLMDHQGGWGAICSLTEEDRRIRFFEALKKASDPNILIKQETDK